ncbi:hypothetical protein SNEBB_000314 [Seison nebaliae]|nr:hypothetical protein SNEBB_000314 [Seison nebaliae]
MQFVPTHQSFNYTVVAEENVIPSAGNYILMIYLAILLIFYLLNIVLSDRIMEIMSHLFPLPQEPVYQERGSNTENVVASANRQSYDVPTLEQSYFTLEKQLADVNVKYTNAVEDRKTVRNKFKILEKEVKSLMKEYSKRLF